MFLLLKLVELYNYVFDVFGFHVYKVEMTYEYDGKSKVRTTDPFWRNEKRYWLRRGEPEEHWSDVTHDYKNISTNVSNAVRDILFRIKYTFRNRKYTYKTNSSNKRK